MEGRRLGIWPASLPRARPAAPAQLSAFPAQPHPPQLKQVALLCLGALHENLVHVHVAVVERAGGGGGRWVVQWVAGPGRREACGATPAVQTKHWLCWPQSRVHRASILTSQPHPASAHVRRRAGCTSEGTTSRLSRSSPPSAVRQAPIDTASVVTPARRLRVRQREQTRRGEAGRRPDGHGGWGCESQCKPLQTWVAAGPSAPEGPLGQALWEHGHGAGGQVHRLGARLVGGRE